jgi:hypothetical protein
MSIIFKISEDGTVPKWLSEENSLPEFKGGITTEDADRIVSFPESLDENGITAEMDEVEHRALAGSDYFFNVKWGNAAVSQIMEYAEACGFKGKMVGVNPDDDKIVACASKPKEAITRTAAVQVPGQMSIAEALGDPFHLGAKVSTDEDTGVRLRREAKERKEHRKEGWEKVTPEQKLSNPTVMANSNCVIKAPGADDYRTSPALHVRRGENSITEPDAIGALAKTEDTGERLRREAKQRQELKKSQKTMWQNEVAKQGSDIEKEAKLPQGSVTSGRSVFMTSAGDAQPGLRDSMTQMGVFQKPEDVELVPDKTAGESLKSRNEERKASIQRRKDESKEWQKLQGASRHEITDVFAEEIEKRLQGI